MPLVDGPACRLWVEEVGSGAPVTVVAHGLTGSSEELRDLVSLVEGTRVLFDLRGHGRSEAPPDAGYDHAAMRADLEHVADRAGATNAIGVSLGASALLQLIAERPARFARLVFLTPAAVDRPNGSVRRLSVETAERLEREPLESVAAWLGRGDAFERRPHWRKLVRERTLRMNPVGAARALRAFASGAPPLTDAQVLGSVAAPALVIAHRGDRVHPESAARRLAEVLPEAQLDLWDEPLQMFDDPRALAERVAFFLAGRSGAAGVEYAAS